MESGALAPGGVRLQVRAAPVRAELVDARLSRAVAVELGLFVVSLTNALVDDNREHVADATGLVIGVELPELGASLLPQRVPAGVVRGRPGEGQQKGDVQEALQDAVLSPRRVNT